MQHRVPLSITYSYQTAPAAPPTPPETAASDPSASGSPQNEALSVACSTESFDSVKSSLNFRFRLNFFLGSFVNLSKSFCSQEQ